MGFGQASFQAPDQYLFFGYRSGAFPFSSNPTYLKMNKKFLIGTIAVFVVWEILDFVIHGVILKGAYAATSSLWRAEMNTGLMIVVTLIAAAAFAYIYAEFIGNKSVATAVKYGFVYGIGAGVSFAYGSYAVMDIPYSMALTWFLGTIVEALAAGYVCGMIIKAESAAA